VTGPRSISVSRRRRDEAPAVMLRVRPTATAAPADPDSDLSEEPPMHPLVLIAAFAAAVAVMNRLLRRREAQGDFDVGPSAAAQPGLRRFFDYSEGGWRRDGVRQ
jgi:hypothetical protein